jgi:hypothetical protein
MGIIDITIIVPCIVHIIGRTAIITAGGSGLVRCVNSLKIRGNARILQEIWLRIGKTGELQEKRGAA